MNKQIRQLALVGAFAFFTVSGPASAARFGYKSLAVYGDASGSWPDAVVVGDVTGDGRDDAVLATAEYFNPAKDFNLFIYAQTAQGTLAPPVQLPYLGTVTGFGVRLQMADLNNDGIKDIVVGHDLGLTVFISLGNRRFKTSSIIAPGQLYALAAADINGDGNIDVVKQGYEGDLSILLGNGKGELGPVRKFAASAAWHQAFRIADVTADALPDLIFANQTSLTIHPGKGNGDFAPPRKFPYPGTDTRGFSSLAIADVNHDGRKDILAATAANLPTSKIWIYEQAVDGRLSSPRTIPSFDMPEALSVADLDRDGYQDVFTMHGGWYRIGFYLQGRSGLAPEVLTFSPQYLHATHFNQDGMATGDLDGDGCTDTAIADNRDGLDVVHGQNCYEPWTMANGHHGDFDGDGKSDILWHDTASGASTIWRSGNSAEQIPMVQVTDTRWVIAGIGDFNGDGKSDVLWHHATTGANALWRSGDYSQSTSLTRINNLAWEIVGIGDFDGNGKDDILWRQKYTGANAVWGGGSYNNAWNLSAVTDPDWKVVGVGDFDGNQKADVLWRHRADGRNAIWRGAVHSDNQAISAISNTAWQVAGVGDFDKDGRSDILWRLGLNGQIAIWHSANVASNRTLTQVTDLRWKIAGVGDYDHDGRSDIFWRHADGTNVIWRDGNFSTRRAVTGITDMDWKAIK